MLFLRLSANQIKGPPDVYPKYGDIRNTWAQKGHFKDGWIQVNSFSRSMLQFHWITKMVTDQTYGCYFNTLMPRQNGRHFADDIFKYFFVNEKFCISINISLKFVPKGQINNNTALVQIMAWRRIGDKPLSEPMLIQPTDAYMRHKGVMS